MSPTASRRSRLSRESQKGYNERLRLSLSSTLSLLPTRPAARLRAPNLLPKARRSPAKRTGQASKERPAPQREALEPGAPRLFRLADHYRTTPRITPRRLPHSFFTFSAPEGEERVCLGALFDWNRSCLRETRALGFLIQPLRREGGTCPREDPGAWKLSRKRRAEPEREAETPRQSRLGGAVWDLTPRLANTICWRCVQSLTKHPKGSTTFRRGPAFHFLPPFQLQPN